MTVYLAKLNLEQRRAAEHGVGAADDRPLLVIAGAGSGKTNTLAHRVAHLIVNGVDPNCIIAARDKLIQRDVPVLIASSRPAAFQP